MQIKFASQMRSLPLFNERSPAQLDQLWARGRERALKHKEVLYHSGESAQTFAVVIQGAFKLIRSSPQGQDTIVFFATPGDLIGALLMAAETSTYPVSAVAMGPAIVLELPRETFLKSWAGDSKIQQRMNGMLFSRISLFHDQKALTKAPLAQKIACQLLSLIERYCGERESILPIPLTRQEIADAVGASVESVIRIMSEWRREGMIETSDQLIHVVKMEKLLAIIKSPGGE